MSHPEWFAILVCGMLGGIFAGVLAACNKLDRIIQLLIVANRQRDGDYDR